ncbi:hypothetical protein EJ04DRAFT_414015, partial [Polyplosphaeria fusca]
QREILDLLSPSSYASHHKDIARVRLPGTWQWVLEHAEFRSWEEGEGKALYCHGNPGSGKTVPTSRVIDHLRDTCSAQPRIGIAHIYCNFKRDGGQTADLLLASIARQLVETLPSFPNRLQDLHQAAGPGPQIQDTMDLLVELLSPSNRAFIVVDALDECQDSARRFISSLASLRAKSRIQVFATCRPSYKDFTNDFTNSAMLDIRAIKADVQCYLEGNIHRLPKFVKGNHELLEEICSSIIKAVDGI